MKFNSKNLSPWLKIFRVMKLTIFIFFVMYVHASASGLSQNITISVKNAPVQEVLTLISRQTGLSIIYNESFFNNSENVSIDVKDKSVDEVLGICLNKEDFSYNIENGMVYIKKHTKIAQQNTSVLVKGQIVDKEGNPLPGATVMLKGTMQGVTTDAEGYYSIKVNTGSVLVFSFLGFKQQEIVVSTENTQLDVILEDWLSELGEIVVSTGYQKIKPEQVTGSVGVMKAKEYNSRINTVDFLAGLQNKIPGLLINNDIDFEDNSLFQIRGISTINGSRDPLIVIDGYPTELSIDMINPNEIESVTVLKDAAAATIYGVRASNGVIVIERKKAKQGKTAVEFSTTLSVRPKDNYDRYRWDKDASNVNINFVKDTYVDNGSYIWNLVTNPNASPDFDLDPITYILAQQSAEVISEEDANLLFDEMGSYNNSKEYSRLFLRNRVDKTYNLSLSGGSENALYYITANHTDSRLSEINNDDQKTKFLARTTIKFSERFSLDLTNHFQMAVENSVPVPDISNFYAFEHFEDEEGNPLSTYYNSYANPYYNDYLIEQGLQDNRYYPLQEIKEVSTKTKGLNNRFVANFNFDVNKSLSLSFGGVYETSRTDERTISTEKSAEVRQYVNYYTSEDDDGGLVLNLPLGSVLKQNRSSDDTYTLRAQLNYNERIKDNHSINFIFGGELRDVLVKSSASAYFGYNDQNLLSLPIDNNILESSNYSPTYASANPSLSYSSLFNHEYEDNRFVSLYTNLVYAFKSKYSVTGSMRIDQSNLFGTDPKYRYKPLWSLGAAWNINKENFMQNLYWLNSLKLRAAYGFNGNIAKNSLPQVIAESDYNSYDPNNGTMLSLLSPANSGLRWEQTSNMNVGLDYNIFKSISGSFEYYVKKSTDLLAVNQIDATKGLTSAYVNQATIRNNGFEIDLNADWISKGRFNWNTGFVFSHNSSLVLSVASDLTESSLSSSYLSGSSTNFLEGYEIGAMFNYRYAGLNNEGYPLIYDKDGMAKEVYSNDEGILDVEYVGSSVPTYNMGLSNRVDIGDFYVYCMINFYGGFKTRVPVPYAGDTRPLEGSGNYWMEAGDEEDPDMLPYLNTSYYEYLSYSDKYTVNGAYVTLGDLTASYSFRSFKWLKEKGIHNLELRMQASNLYTKAFNKYNYSKAVGSYEKRYITPTYTMSLDVNF